MPGEQNILWWPCQKPIDMDAQLTTLPERPAYLAAKKYFSIPVSGDGVGGGLRGQHCLLAFYEPTYKNKQFLHFLLHSRKLI